MYSLMASASTFAFIVPKQIQV